MTGGCAWNDGGRFFAALRMMEGRLFAALRMMGSYGQNDGELRPE